jgi:hypothetical protein
MVLPPINGYAPRVRGSGELELNWILGQWLVFTSSFWKHKTDRSGRFRYWLPKGLSLTMKWCVEGQATKLDLWFIASTDITILIYLRMFNLR